MATSFFNGSFFGGEFFNVAVVVDSPTQTPAGKSRKRKWVIGNRTFYGTADEASVFADELELPQPVRAKKAKPVFVVPPFVPVEPVLPAPPEYRGIEFGTLDHLLQSQQFDREIGERIALLAKILQEQDDEDAILLWL